MESSFTSALLCMRMMATTVQKTITLKAVKEELNKIYAIELAGELYPV